MTAVPDQTSGLPTPLLSEAPQVGGVHRHRSPSRGGLLAALGVVAAWLATVLVATEVQVGPDLHQLALFAHLAALLVGFGAALTVEWFGLLWVLGRRPLSAVVQTAHGAHLPIWLGLVGLAASGIILSPERLSAVSTVKLVVVLVVALNGLYARRVQRQLTDHDPVPRSAMARAAASAAVSQAGWWTATAIGFLATQQ